MHVLLLPSSYPRFYKPISGIFFRDQAIALKNGGMTVGVIDPAPRTVRTLMDGGVISQRFQIETTTDDGVPVVHANDWCVPYLRKLYAKQFVARARDLFESYIRQFGAPDVIHAHGILWGGVAAREISRESGIPYVVTEHSGEYATSPLEDWKIEYVRSTIDTTAAMLVVSAELSRRLNPFNSDHALRIVPNVVDTDFFKAPAARSLDGSFLFASIAAQMLDKGIDVLLRAFRATFADSTNIRLEIGGDGPDRGRFEALAHELGVARQVTWLGELNRKEVRDCLHRADGFILPSRYETFGVVFIEAMSTGLPVIASKCGGPQDFIDDDCGYLVDVNNVEQTAEAMQEMCAGREGWRWKEERIRNRTVDRFGQAVIARQLLDVYAEVTSVGSLVVV